MTIVVGDGGPVGTSGPSGDGGSTGAVADGTGGDGADAGDGSDGTAGPSLEEPMPADGCECGATGTASLGWLVVVPLLRRRRRAG